MDLQAIRYASMVSTLTFDRAVDFFSKYLLRLGKTDQDAREALLDFLDWDEADENQFAQDVRIVLASAEFSKELTSSVLWLNNHDLDIRCVRLKPYRLDKQILVDVQQIIPLPEVQEYQVQVREKEQKERQARESNADFTRFDVWFGTDRREAMWKRNAIAFVCKKLCENGVRPEAIKTLFSWRPNRVWFAVDGTVKSEDFKTLAVARAAAEGNIFKHRRWSIEDDQLVYFEGKTYALSSQWGGDRWHEAMQLLVANYKNFGIRYEAVVQ